MHHREPDRSPFDHRFTALGFLHVGHHRLEFLFKLCEPGFLYFFAERAGLSEDLLPAARHASKPDRHKCAQLYSSVGSPLLADRVLQLERERNRAESVAVCFTVDPWLDGSIGFRSRMSHRGGHGEVSGSHDRGRLHAQPLDVWQPGYLSTQRGSNQFELAGHP